MLKFIQETINKNLAIPIKPISKTPKTAKEIVYSLTELLKKFDGKDFEVDRDFIKLNLGFKYVPPESNFYRTIIEVIRKVIKEFGYEPKVKKSFEELAIKGFNLFLREYPDSTLMIDTSTGFKNFLIKVNLDCEIPFICIPFGFCGCLVGRVAYYKNGIKIKDCKAKVVKNYILCKNEKPITCKFYPLKLGYENYVLGPVIENYDPNELIKEINKGKLFPVFEICTGILVGFSIVGSLYLIAGKKYSESIRLIKQRNLIIEFDGIKNKLQILNPRNMVIEGGFLS